MYNSQYYTCEQIDQRLLQGYLDDYNSQNNTNLTKAEFLTLLFNTIGRNSTLDNLVTQIGYYECDTAGATAAKVITIANYNLFAGGSMKVKFANKNTANNATLNINGKGAKALYYQGERASANNSWDAEEVVEIYYDGTSYYANNVNGGSGSGVYDVSKEHPTSGPNSDGKFTLEYILNSSNVNELIPVNKRYPGMSIQFVSTSDNKYVQYRLMSDTFSITESDWQGIDDEPTAGSDNLVKSGGVYEKISQLDQEPIKQVGYWSNTQNKYVTTGGYSLFIPIKGYLSIIVKGRNAVTGEIAFVTGFTNNSVTFVTGVSGTTTIDADTEYTISVPNDAMYLMVFDTDTQGTGRDRKPSSIIADRYRDLYIPQFKDLWDNTLNNTTKINSISSVAQSVGGLVSGGYLYSDNSVSDIVSSIDNYVCARIKCNSGDKWYIRGYGGDTVRLWAFVNNDNTVIDIADSGAYTNGLLLSAPSDCYLIVNFKSTQTYSITKYSLSDWYFSNGEYQYAYANLDIINDTTIRINTFTYKKWGGSAVQETVDTNYDMSQHSFLLIRNGIFTTEVSSSNILNDDIILLVYTSAKGFSGGLLMPCVNQELLKIYHNSVVDVNNIKDTLDGMGAFSEGYYDYNPSTGKVNLTRASSDSLLSAKVKCKKDDIWCLSGSGGGTARFWAFVEDDGSVIDISAASAYSTHLLLVAPSTCYLVVNVKKNGYFYDLYKYSPSDYYFELGEYQYIYPKATMVNEYTVKIESIVYKRWGGGVQSISINTDYNMLNYSFLVLRNNSVVSVASSSSIQLTDVILLVYTSTHGFTGGIMLPNVVFELSKKQIGYFENYIQTRDSICYTPWTALSALPLNNGVEGGISAGEHPSFPYSSVKELDKYIGYDVSVYTFLTAAANQYSLLYTENVNGSHSRSAYGITYHGTNCGTYYGMVCNVHSCYTRGLTIPYNSAEHPWMCDVGILTKREYQDAVHVQIGDILRKEGHCVIVLNKDSTLIRTSEASVPFQQMYGYTYETFNQHIIDEGYTIYYVSDKYAHNKDAKLDYNWHYSANNDAAAFNRDICCFAGDRALFREGDIVAVNYNLDTVGNWTHIELYKDNVLVQTLMIDSNEHTLLLTPYCATKGIYKARMKYGDTYSDYTYFKVIDTNVSYTISNGLTTVEFDSSIAEPLYLEVCEITGKTWLIYELSKREIGRGSCTINIDNLIKAQHDGELPVEDVYIKVHFEDEFGRITNHYVQYLNL